MACVFLYRRPSDRCCIGLQHGRLNCCCLGAGSVGNVCIRWYQPNSHTGPIGGYRQSVGRCGRQFFMRLPVIHIAGCRAAVREYSPDLGEKRRTWVFVIISHETRSSPARRNLMSEYPHLSISLTRPSIRRDVERKVSISLRKRHIARVFHIPQVGRPTWRHSDRIQVCNQTRCGQTEQPATGCSPAVKSRCRRGFFARWPFPHLLPRILRARTDVLRFAGG